MGIGRNICFQKYTYIYSHYGEPIFVGTHLRREVIVWIIYFSLQLSDEVYPFFEKQTNKRIDLAKFSRNSSIFSESGWLFISFSCSANSRDFEEYLGRHCLDGNEVIWIPNGLKQRYFRIFLDQNSIYSITS